MRLRNILPDICCGFCLLLVGISFVLAEERRFLPDDPVWQDPDSNPIDIPEPRDLSQLYDFLENTFLRRPKGEVSPAENVNTLGEVPDSSWFTNRIGLFPMTIEELVRGPDGSEGPDMSEPWTIVAAKTQGITPGFRIRDGRGDIYFVKFDPPSNPQMATSAEVISTKFFYAFGYHVPENYLAQISRDRVRIGDNARVTGEDGKRRPMTEADVDEIFRSVAVDESGHAQVIASKGLTGRPLGPFKYLGTRRDDPNDIFPHENRRELRGLRIFASWLNHDDTRSVNSLDMFISIGGEKGYVRHHLVDFGSCLGSGSVRPQSRRAGNEYIVEGAAILKSALTLGLWERAWRKVRYPDFPSLGRIEGDFFEPQLWKPEYPNPAFERMRPVDAFWAVRTVSRFNDDMIRAIVRTGRLADPEAELYLSETLIKRRDKILHYYLRRMNPLTDFEIVDSDSRPRLRFRNLGVEIGVGDADGYSVEWFAFDNDSGTLRPPSNPVAQIQRVRETSIDVPADPSPYLMVRIRTLSEAPAWHKAVDVYLGGATTGRSMVGLEREE